MGKRWLAALVVCVMALLGWRETSTIWMGRQPNGTYRVSSGQDVLPGSIAFPGRPSGFALNPEREMMAVQTDHQVFLCSSKGVWARTRCALPQDVGAGFRGILWTGIARRWKCSP